MRLADSQKWRGHRLIDQCEPIKLSCSLFSELELWLQLGLLCKGRNMRCITTLYTARYLVVVICTSTTTLIQTGVHVRFWEFRTQDRLMEVPLTRTWLVNAPSQSPSVKYTEFNDVSSCERPTCSSVKPPNFDVEIVGINTVRGQNEAHNGI